MEPNTSLPVITSSLETLSFQENASETHHQLEEQLSPSERKGPEMKINSTPPHGVRPGTQLLALPTAPYTAPYTRGVSKLHALKSNSDLDLAQFKTCACVRIQGRLTDIVSRYSFTQELCKRFCTQDLSSFSEDDLINCLEPLLFNTTKTQEDTLTAKPIPRSSTDGLPEELVELVISRIPFPSLFKARALSRAWFYAFPFGKVRSLRPSFQNQISSASSRWITYCPIIFTNTDILCFDRLSYRWKPMLSLSYLPLDVYNLRNANIDLVCTRDSFECSVTTAGPLVCIFHDYLELNDNHNYNHRIFVSNVVAKSWRQLPEPPRIQPDDYTDHPLIKLLQVGTDCYKVLVLYITSTAASTAAVAHIYSSRLRTWTVKRYDMNPNFGPFSCWRFIGDIAYVDKKFTLLHVSGFPQNDLTHVNHVMHCLQINEDDENDDDKDLVLTNKLEHDGWLRLPPQSHKDVSRECFRQSASFVHKEKLMVVVCFDANGSRRRQRRFSNCFSNRIGIFQLDPLTRQLTELCRGPPIAVAKELKFPIDASDYRFSDMSLMRHGYRYIDTRFASDGDFIYISLILFRIYEVVMTCNLQSLAWSFIPAPPMGFIPRNQSVIESGDKRWVESVFQPGSNPFASV